MEIDSAARLFVATVDEIATRAPAISAAAARELHGIRLGLHFGDGTRAGLRSENSFLFASPENIETPDVEVFFDDRSLNLLYDLEHTPVSEVWERSLDVRGERPQVLAAWRTFRLLSQRASGLRAVQILWRDYRDRTHSTWSAPPADAMTFAANPLTPRDTGWSALDFLDHVQPDEIEAMPRLAAPTIVERARMLWDGHRSSAWTDATPISDSDLDATLTACKRAVADEMQRLIPDREPKAELYDLMRSYPMREGKGLRPMLTIATCGALGGRSIDAVRTAAAIELFHNGFLVHDDISDGSTHRRSKPTLHEAFGVGLAVNTGDGMNLLAIDAILSNLSKLGLARTLGLIHEIMHMCRETVEGQAIELGWIRDCIVPPHDEDYFVMSTKKTGWYTCISPCRLGAVCAGETSPELLDRFNEAFRLIGIAFQIQDDVLNLVGDESLYGKEQAGDLLEGKRTVMLIHAMREADPKLRARLTEILRLPRGEKSTSDTAEILTAMQRLGSIDYAIKLADDLAHQGVHRFEEDLRFLPENESKGALRQIANYVTTRRL